MSTWPLWAAGLNAKEVDLRVRVVPPDGGGSGGGFSGGGLTAPMQAELSPQPEIQMLS